MSSIEKVCEELRDLGYAPDIISGDGVPAQLAVIDYPVATGRYKGRSFKIGIGFQETGYPEYPPHWVCIEGLSAGDVQINVHSTFQYGEENWLCFSVPPNDFWDNLKSAEKTMKTFLSRHLVRFWSQL